LTWVGSANSESATVLLHGRVGCAFINMGALGGLCQDEDTEGKPARVGEKK